MVQVMKSYPVVSSQKPQGYAISSRAVSNCKDWACPVGACIRVWKYVWLGDLNFQAKKQQTLGGSPLAKDEEK